MSRDNQSKVYTGIIPLFVGDYGEITTETFDIYISPNGKCEREDKVRQRLLLINTSMGKGAHKAGKIQGGRLVELVTLYYQYEPKCYCYCSRTGAAASFESML